MTKRPAQRSASRTRTGKPSDARTRPASKAVARGRSPSRQRPAAGAAPDPLKAFCRSIPGTTEDIKWGDDLVFSIGGKMYAAFDVDDGPELGFKCDDDDYDRLTEIDGIIPAPYAARWGWVMVKRRAALGDAELKRLLRKARDLVYAKLPARVRREITP